MVIGPLKYCSNDFVCFCGVCIRSCRSRVLRLLYSRCPNVSFDLKCQYCLANVSAFSSFVSTILGTVSMGIAVRGLFFPLDSF